MIGELLSPDLLLAQSVAPENRPDRTIENQDLIP
jgi:hypothetical protein